MEINYKVSTNEQLANFNLQTKIPIFQNQFKLHAN
jgi:hypothetical protein